MEGGTKRELGEYFLLLIHAGEYKILLYYSVVQYLSFSDELVRKLIFGFENCVLGLLEMGLA